MGEVLTVIDEGGTKKPIPIHGAEAFAAMHRAGELAARTLDHVTPMVRPGVTTGELDREIETFMIAHGGVPATKGYRGYTGSSCISVNHVVNHGIPTFEEPHRASIDPKYRGKMPRGRALERPWKLASGDIVNIDVTVILDGWHGDTSRMYVVGGKAKTRRGEVLVEKTFEAMWAGIDAVRPGATLGDVGFAIQSVARKARFSVVRDFVGHGVGREFHQAPEVRHYGRKGHGTLLVPGMIFTIEPMINEGGEDVVILDDGWTTVTVDGSLSAQFEHTVGVTEDGVEIFTLSPAGLDKPPYNV